MKNRPAFAQGYGVAGTNSSVTFCFHGLRRFNQTFHHRDHREHGEKRFTQISQNLIDLPADKIV